jgi:hypothetical protein
MADDPTEALRRLEERLNQASQAAERLLADAARSARGVRPPPAGWQAPDPDPDPRTRGAGAELEALMGAVKLMWDLIPADVLERLVAALRELLLALRALIDFYLEHLERPRSRPEDVRDIPID